MAFEGTEPPPTQYVSVGDSDIAYQVLGEGPIDVLSCDPLGVHVDLFWQAPRLVNYLAQVSAISRLIFFDRRGCGASDPVPLTAIPTWEELAEDMTAVLDAVESTWTSLMGTLETGPIAILFAAMHPQRVRSLILINTTARFLTADDYPEGSPPETADAIVDLLARSWGTEEFAGLIVPGLAGDHQAMSALARMFRASATPRSAAAQYRYFMQNIDVRHVLPLVQVPTLVIHAKDNPFIPLAHGRHLAEHIAGARLIEVDGAELSPGPQAEGRGADFVEFLTGERPQVEIERVLTTVLFTDIVGSTERAASLGDTRWRSLLDSHDRIVRAQLSHFRGREVNTTGDGFVASFDGPARAIRCAKAIIDATSHQSIQIRAGLHTGECEVRGDDLGGLAVHIAARVAALASPGETLVSGTVKDLVIGSGIEFSDRGDHELKGVPDTWKLFSVSQVNHA